MKVGFFSPLPPARTGVADYSAALLARMRQFGEVEVGNPSADVSLYHLGNNQLHRDIYNQALLRAGVVVLHDAVLHHFFLGSLSEAAYVAEFTYNYGQWSQDQARELWRQRARSAADPRYFRYPLLKRMAETSKAVIVHNPGAAEMVRAHAPTAEIRELPFLFDPPALSASHEIERLRASMGIPASTLLCGVFGHLRESKRVLPILRAFAKARSQVSIALLIAGEFVSTDLARAAEPLLKSPGIVRVGYTPGDRFWQLAAMLDVCINLRYPAAGETSAIGSSLMGIGKPVMFTTGPETSRFPEASCIRVDAGVAEDEMVAQYLIWLALNRADGVAIGARAATHIRERHAPDQVAKLYWDVCQSVLLS